MPFSMEDKALTKNSYQFKNMVYTKESDRIFDDKLQKGTTGHFSKKKIWET